MTLRNVHVKIRPTKNSQHFDNNIKYGNSFVADITTNNSNFYAEKNFIFDINFDIIKNTDQLGKSFSHIHRRWQYSSGTKYIIGSPLCTPNFTASTKNLRNFSSKFCPPLSSVYLSAS